MDNIHKYFFLIVFADYMRREVDLTKDIQADQADMLSSGRSSIPANQLRLSQSFVQYMGDNSWLRDLVEGGKGDLQWERDIPGYDVIFLSIVIIKCILLLLLLLIIITIIIMGDVLVPEAALANLKSLVATDFMGNLGLIIHDIYHTAHYMFADMPQVMGPLGKSQNPLPNSSRSL